MMAFGLVRRRDKRVFGMVGDGRGNRGSASMVTILFSIWGSEIYRRIGIWGRGVTSRPWAGGWCRYVDWDVGA
jgi:hypothetical protein